ncbi:MAG: hypothetical protein KKF41_14395 [Actinobacteria bacterium]|nr:hypothetical protein [Actinomycetota bacterium]MBU1942157.1 hypothetical protein [Actinomycetota bacterium]MBU2688764.1 hypothetical protein [Actinomycetota bacterium]
MSAAGAGGSFGSWGTDGLGLPCFDLDPHVFDDPTLVLPAGGPGDIWHQVGNDRLTATAHAGGRFTLYAFEGGPVALTGPGGGSRWEVLTAAGAPAPVGTPEAVRWGTGYAEWRWSTDRVTVTRTVTAPYGDLPCLVVDVRVSAPEPVRVREVWTLRPYPLIPGPLMSRTRPVFRDGQPLRWATWRLMFATSAAARRLTDLLRALAGWSMPLSPHRDHGGSGAVVLASRHPGRSTGLVPRLERDVFVSIVDAPGARIEASSRRPAVSVTLAVPLGEGGGAFSYTVGLAARGEVDGAVEEIRGSRGRGPECWAGAFSTAIGSEPALQREASWHFYYLRSARVEEDLMGPYIPQGSAYGFVHGGQGAPRDYAFSAVPLACLDPPAASELLRVTARMMRPDGSTYYAHAGRGALGPPLVHSFPTDLSLFFMWALAEYVWASGDAEFLSERVPFGPGGGGGSTMLDRALAAWRHTRDGVGTGPHGMLRVGSGDWSDPLALMVGDRRAFARDGESSFNTAMGAHVLPMGADLLADSHPADAREMRQYAASLRSCMEASWQGRWYPRGYDGRGGVLGGEHLFLDAQVWCLIAGIGDAERCRTLSRTVHGLCEVPSPVGATILDRPHRVRLGILPPGWDCNGGVWAAMNSLLAWGYALREPGLALQCLKRQSLAAHATAYPRVWFGVWSGPDAYNSYLGMRPGETFIHPATPMQEFPVMNSNAHAGPLLGLLKALGVQASPAGVTVTPRPEVIDGPWRITSPYLDIACDGETAEVVATPWR